MWCRFTIIDPKLSLFLPSKANLYVLNYFLSLFVRYILFMYFCIYAILLHLKIFLSCFVCCWIILTIIIRQCIYTSNIFIHIQRIWECNNHHHSKRTKTFLFHSLISFDWCYKVCVTLIGNLVALVAKSDMYTIWTEVKTTF